MSTKRKWLLGLTLYFVAMNGFLAHFLHSISWFDRGLVAARESEAHTST